MNVSTWSCYRMSIFMIGMWCHVRALDCYNKLFDLLKFVSYTILKFQMYGEIVGLFHHTLCWIWGNASETTRREYHNQTIQLVANVHQNSQWVPQTK